MLSKTSKATHLKTQHMNSPFIKTKDFSTRRRLQERLKENELKSIIGNKYHCRDILLLKKVQAFIHVLEGN